MNLIFVYGPPAVGKHTVGLELAELTSYRLFHNHLTVPPVNAIFNKEVEAEAEARSALLKRLRVVSIQAAAQAGINLIFTAAYSGGDKDEAFIQEIVDVVEATGGRVMFAQLHASLEVLLARVISKSRVQLGLQKMTDPERYRRRLQVTGRNLMVSVNYPDICMVDTQQLLPAAAAHRIAEHFRLLQH